ncbi:MAG: hypothetical protein RBQ94_02875 [Methanimicrococcus sp.]|nr:hypothetical protein [Methanimicrococcus sp.]
MDKTGEMFYTTFEKHQYKNKLHVFDLRQLFEKTRRGDFDYGSPYHFETLKTAPQTDTIFFLAPNPLSFQKNVYSDSIAQGGVVSCSIC